ncbi:TonB-dependent siderophore receptor [compost metagenome]
MASSDEVLPDEVTHYRDTDISFSPNIISGGNITYLVAEGFSVSLLPKYVGKQYLDNTSSEDKKLDGYFISDLNVSFTPKAPKLKDLNLTLLVNNIFNKEYESNGYTYSYIYGEKITENFVFPQAGINFLAGVRVRF